MGKLLDLYLSNFIKRYDKDGIIPYLSNADFPGLMVREDSFINSKSNRIAYFEYYYDNHRMDKTILFLHGIGPGHTAYMSEINEIARRGYRVITLDYTGCDKSMGESIGSLNQPTADVDELLRKLDLKEEIIVIGHSLGGYTALNTINIHSEIKKAVIISGFISIKRELNALMKIPFLSMPALRYEKRLLNGYNDIDNIEYLRNTSDSILFIHSTDDQMVPYGSSTGYIKKYIENDNLSFLIEENKKHNPNYSLGAVKYMNDVFSEYNRKSKELDTIEKKKEYMKDKSAIEMTIQDERVWEEIFRHIEK